MAKYIHCKECKERLEAAAKRHNELYEYREGKALVYMTCDGVCGAPEINVGDTCYAAVLLRSRDHPNYEKQKPENWATEFVDF